MKIHGGHPYKSTSIMGWCGVFLCWSFFRSSNINYFGFMLCLKDARHIYIYIIHTQCIYVAYLCLQSLYTYKVYRQYIQYFPLYNSVYILYVYLYIHTMYTHTYIYIYTVYIYTYTHTQTTRHTHTHTLYIYASIYPYGS